MKNVKINTDNIDNLDSLHDVLSVTFGFPEFYGKNIDALIDCMSYLDDWRSGMTKVLVERGNTLYIELENYEKFKKRCFDILLVLQICIDMVNLNFKTTEKFTEIKLIPV